MPEGGQSRGRGPYQRPLHPATGLPDEGRIRRAAEKHPRVVVKRRWPHPAWQAGIAGPAREDAPIQQGAVEKERDQCPAFSPVKSGAASPLASSCFAIIAFSRSSPSGLLASARATSTA